MNCAHWQLWCHWHSSFCSYSYIPRYTIMRNEVFVYYYGVLVQGVRSLFPDELGTTSSKSLSKMLRKIPDYPIGSDWLSSCNSALTLRALKTSKIKNLKRSNFSQSVFFRAQNALCSKTGGAIVGLLVSKQVGMVFSSSPTCLSLVGVNQPTPTRFRCRNQKI